jgi:hypothetical protein
MAQTNSRGYPYPDDLSEADIPADLAALAFAVDADVSALTFDTGWSDVDFVNNFTAGFEGARMRRKAGRTDLQIMAVSAGGTAAWGTETVLFRLPQSMRPKYNFWALANNEGLTLEVRVMSNGDVRLVTPSRPDRGGVIVFATNFPID